MIADADKRTIGISVAWLSQVFEDLDHQASNTTRAERLFESSGLAGWQFTECIRSAYSGTLKHQPGLRRPMAYFFRLLEDQTQRLTHGLTALEAMAFIQSQPGGETKSKNAGTRKGAAR